ncbi:hypothetical protein V8C86DRAFT_2833769 [Haematococcus lacustris]
MHQALGGLRRISPSHPNAPGVRGTTRVRAASSQNPHLKDNHGKGFADVSLHKRHETVPHAHSSSGAGRQLLHWLQENGAQLQGVELKSIEPPALYGTTASNGAASHSHPHNRPIDMAVASRPLQPGDLALSIPSHLVITLDRVFESEFVAELMVTDKLSELACLTLYLMYEKKLREDSFWQPYIKELDRQRARGTQAVESPILWAEEELEELLTGSPLLATVRQRLAGIEHEYKELDTVWYMACSLFNRYPFDLPTETFSFERFKQAFAAVQASIVHLQGVPPSRRFALVPLGPPLLSYSSTSKALFTYNEASKCVELRVDQSYSPGDPVSAWCGPQPNTRLLLNYGLVDENNPYDKLQVSVILASTDPLYQLKRSLLQAVNLSTSQPFDLQRNKKLAPLLLPYMRLAAASSPEEVQQVVLSEAAPPVAGDACEALLLAHLTEYFNARLAGYKHTMAEDMDIMISPRSSPRQKVAARLTKIEKGILTSCLEQLQQLAAQSQVPLPTQLQGTLPHVKLV